jgi:hypothetical protein
MNNNINNSKDPNMEKTTLSMQSSGLSSMSSHLTNSLLQIHSHIRPDSIQASNQLNSLFPHQTGDSENNHSALPQLRPITDLKPFKRLHRIVSMNSNPSNLVIGTPPSSHEEFTRLISSHYAKAMDTTSSSPTSANNIKPTDNINNFSNSLDSNGLPLSPLLPAIHNKLYLRTDMTSHGSSTK